MFRPDIVARRIVGRDSANTLAVNGGRPWWEVKEYMEKLMRNRDRPVTIFMGQLFKDFCMNKNFSLVYTKRGEAL